MQEKIIYRLDTVILIFIFPKNGLNNKTVLIYRKEDNNMIYRRVYGVPSFGVREPFSELERMRRQMDRLFSDFSSLPGYEPRAGVFPLVNITEGKDNFYVRAELPGVKAGGLDIQATANNISISGERKIPAEAEGVKYHRREREAGKFSRMISLPSDINTAKVSADLSDGILTLTVPKAEAAKPRQISVS
jgi:HSP20 family protein